MNQYNNFLLYLPKRRNTLFFFLIPISNYFFSCLFTLGFKSNDFHSGTWVFRHFFLSAYWMPVTLIVILSIFSVFFYNKNEKIIEFRIKKYIIYFSFLWSIFFSFGKSYFILNNWALVFGSIFNFIFILVLSIFSTISVGLYICILLILFNKINNIYISLDLLNKKNIFKISLVSFLIINFVYLITFFPGIITWDGRFQLTQFYGIYLLNNHHPIISTLLEGVIIEFGKMIFSYDLGLFIFCFIQSIIQAITFAFILKTIANITNNKLILMISYFYFLLNPILAIWGISLGKDTIYYLSFLCFLAILVEIQNYHIEKISYGVWLKLFICMLLVALFRKEGFVIIILSLIFYTIFNIDVIRTVKKKWISMIFFYLIIFLSYTFTLNFYNITSPSKEALAIPFQQTARLVWSEKQIDKDDMDNLQEIFNQRNLKKIYNPSFADPVKNAFTENHENYTKWKNIYLKYLKRYPAVYIQAFFNQNYGYFYPFIRPIDYGYYTIPKDDVLRDDIIHFDTISKFTTLQSMLKTIPDVFMGLPFLNLYYNCSFFVWSLLFFFGMAIIKKKWNIVSISVPLLLTIGVCLLSPVGADARYMLPIIVSFPLWVIFSLKELCIIK